MKNKTEKHPTIQNGKFVPRKLNKIRKLYLENFKGFQKKNEIFFSPSINLFYGKNSAGKSSVIQSLRLLKQSLVIQGPPVPLLLVLPSYTRVTGSLTFPEGLRGIVNGKDLNKNLLLGLCSYGVRSSDNRGRISRYLINKFDLSKLDELSLKEVNIGKDYLDLENPNENKNMYDFNLKFKKRFFKKGNLLNLLDYAYINPRFDFDFNVKARVEDRKVEREEILYEELDKKNSSFKFNALNELCKVITKNLKEHKGKILDYINNLSNEPSVGIKIENLKKLTSKKGKKKEGKKIFEEGKYSQIKRSELKSLKKFVLSEKFTNPNEFNRYFINDIKKKISLIRYKDRIFDINRIKANKAGFNKADKRGVLPSREYDNFLINILYDALNKPGFDFEGAHQSCLRQNRICIDKIVVVPGLRALPQRYLKRGLQENLIGENAENLGDMIANPETKKNLNYWFKKFEIPYTIDAELVGNYYEIVMRPSGKKYKLSYRDVGLGYSLSLPLLVTCLTNKNSIILIEEPELHLHPKLQANLMDLFLHSSIKNGNQFIIETHSENLLLRAQKCIRKGFNYDNKKIAIDKSIISVNNVYTDGISSNVQKILLNSQGEFKTHWKDGFFADRLDEIF